jgi:NTE family protein
VSRIRAARTVLTVCHENPEADALGSALAVALAVEELGGRATPVCADAVPQMYDFMPGIDRFRQDPDPELAYDLIVVGDCGDLERIGPVLGRNAELFRRVPIVNIDHHVSNVGFGAVDWIDPAAAATCEMDTLLMPALGVPLKAANGAIAAALIAAGYTPEELRREILGLDYRQFEDEGWEDKLPVIDRTASILLDLGIYEGKRFHTWIAGKLEAKGVRTFADLVRDPEEEQLRYRYKLQVIVSDVTERALLVLPRDAGKLGLEPDELPVADAIRMSMSIPIFFEPVRHQNPKTGQEHVLVDGGMLSNFPVWLFDVRDGVPDWPTFGLLLVEPKPREHLGKRIEPPKRDRGVSALIDYLKSLAQTMMAAHDRLYLEQADFARTIPIPTLGVGTTEFNLSPDRAEALYQSGVKAAEEFLADWNWDAYLAEFRSGREHSRRRALAASLEEAVPAG